MAETKENMVMFPFMAQGHIIPFLALAFQLIKTNKYTITFVNTHKNINKLRSSLPPNSSFNLLEIPFNSSDHNLPPDTENTDSVPYNMAPNLIEATLSFKPHFRKLVSDLVSEENGQRKPLCIITDMFFGWCAEIAQEFGVFHAIFIGGGGFGFACYYSLWMNLPHRTTRIPMDFFSCRIFQNHFSLNFSLKLFFIFFGLFTAFSVVLKKVLSPWKNVDGILVNIVEELDNIGLMYFRREIGRQVWPIGPVLLSTGSEARAGKELGISQDVCKNWLDSKPCSSVLYVSFGSQNTIAPSQMMELALALEASGKDFIWVVRPPVGFDINSEFKADDHCGWNSVLEALSHGVPIIGWPMAAKQFYNVKLLEEKMGVCVEVARGKSCQVKHEEIVKIIKLVMNETEKGMEMRRRACEIKEIIENAIKDEVNNKGSSTKAMDEFFNAVLTMRESKMG
ncbi:hypothetical protein ACOSP7_017325 [Xanthoceras sorbifolium]